MNVFKPFKPFIPFRQKMPVLYLESAIKALFKNDEQGLWYDLWDFSTLYQDSAGATPVTGVEQSVGLVLDKSGNGSHATATVAATYKVDALGYRYIDNQVADLSVTLPDLGTDCTVVTVTSVGPAFLTGQTISGSHLLPQDIIYGYIVIDRGLIASEQAAITQYYAQRAPTPVLLLFGIEQMMFGDSQLIFGGTA